MFKKLRNHFVLINLLTTSLILLVSYSVIFAVTSANIHHKPAPLDQFSDLEPLVEPESFDAFEDRILADRKASLDRLLLTLISTGFAVEIIVAFFSVYFAEEAIKPVKTAYEAQKIFIANAAHEIKTPVAAIKANLEAADLSKENRWIGNIEFEAEKIERLNLDLLKLAKTEAIKEAIVLEPTDLSALVTATLTSFEPRLSAKRLKFSLRYRPDEKSPAKKVTPEKLPTLTIKTNPTDLRELLEILLDNAIKYSASNLSLTLSPKTLTVKNDGTTIPPEKLPHIFDRFFQVDKTANGSGLGLAIADSLAKRNRWTLKAASDSTSTSFTLHF